MDTKDLSFLITNLVYNVAIIFSLMKISRNINLKDMVQDKEFLLKKSAAITASIDAVSDHAAAASDAAVAAVAANAAASADTTNENAATTARAASTIAVNAAEAVGKSSKVTPTVEGLDATSYSRITGFAGAVVLTSFFWALGNAVVYNAYYMPSSVKDVLQNVAPFILAGSALFAPYAFNQLTGLFPQKIP